MMYKAESLTDLVEMFLELAARAELAAGRANTQRERSYNNGSAYAYKDVARILASCSLAPWPPD